MDKVKIELTLEQYEILRALRGVQITHLVIGEGKDRFLEIGVDDGTE